MSTLSSSSIRSANSASLLHPHAHRDFSRTTIIQDQPSLIDALELSPSVTAPRSSEPAIREDLVARARRNIANGTYERDLSGKLDVVVNRISRDLNITG